MKNKTIAILLLATTISISGCGGCSKNEASTEPTEVVMETESIIETEEPTETEEVAVETEEPIDIYSDEVIGTLAMYDFFADSTSDEIKTYIEENEDMQELLEYYDSDTIDKALNSMVDLQGKTLYEMNHPSTSTSSTASSNGNTQSGSAKNNQSNSSNQNSSTSNTTNENAASTPDSTNNESPNYDSSDNNGVPTNEEMAQLHIPGVDTDASNFGGDVSDPNNYTHYGNELH